MGDEMNAELLCVNEQLTKDRCSNALLRRRYRDMKWSRLTRLSLYIPPSTASSQTHRPPLPKNLEVTVMSQSDHSELIKSVYELTAKQRKRILAYSTRSEVIDNSETASKCSASLETFKSALKDVFKTSLKYANTSQEIRSSIQRCKTAESACEDGITLKEYIDMYRECLSNGTSSNLIDSGR